MKIFTFLLLSLIQVFSCTRKQNNTQGSKELTKSALIMADNAFSKLCADKGMKNAFIEFIDSNGVLLRPGRLPVAGANAIDYLIQQNDSAYTLSWEPHYATVANSGELGYTYGVYELHPKSRDTVIYGTYTRVWKIQEDGEWKFVLDAGNEGIGNE